MAAIVARASRTNVLEGSKCLLLPVCSLRFITTRALRAKDEEAEYVSGPKFSVSEDMKKLRSQRASRSEDLNRATARMSACVKRRDFNGAWEIYQSICEPDSILHDSALNVCAKAFWTSRAAKLWDNMHPNQKSVISYTSMMDLHGRHQHIDEVERLLDEMTKKELEPNIITYNVLVKAYSLAGRPHQALTTYRSVQDSLFREVSLETNQVMYTLLMSAFARTGDYAMAREIFVEMTGKGVQPAHTHYNALMAACASLGHAEIANQVFEMMQQQGLDPRIEDYTILISCCRNDLDRCRELMAQLRHANLQPLARTYQEMLQAYILAKDAAGAELLLTDAGGCLDTKSRKVQRLLAELAVLPD